MDQPIPFWLVAQFTICPDSFFAQEEPRIGVTTIEEIDGGVAEYLVTLSPELVGELQRSKTSVVVSQWANAAYGPEASLRVCACVNNDGINRPSNQLRVAFLRPDGGLANVAECGTTAAHVSILRTA